MTDNNSVPKTGQDLREMVYHVDARVTAMESTISAVQMGQQRTEQKLDHLIATLNAPTNVNWAAWVGVGLTALTLVFGGLFGTAQYISLVNEPQITDIDNNRGSIIDLKKFEREAQYEFGVMHETTEYVSSDLNKLWDHVHKLEKVDQATKSELSEIEVGVAKTEVGIEALKESLDEIDRYGSRKWIDKKP